MASKKSSFSLGDRLSISWIFLSTLALVSGNWDTLSSRAFTAEFDGILIAWVLLNIIPMYQLYNRKERIILQELKEEEERRLRSRRKKEAKDLPMLKEKLTQRTENAVKANIKTITQAYRKSVTSNSFGKKNYDRFLIDLNEFINDLPEIKELVEEYDNRFNKDASVVFNLESISGIEELISKSEAADPYDDGMDPYEYEQFCADEFKKNGWHAEATQGSSDQGVDVIAKKNGIILVAQCKKYAKPVGNKAVQEVVAGMKYYEATHGIVVAPNGFTNSAQKLASVNKISLLHHTDIKSYEP